MVVQANSFQPGLIFASKVRSLPKRRVSKRCSTLEGSRITRTLTRLERIAKRKQFVLFGICVHIQNTSITLFFMVFTKYSIEGHANFLRISLEKSSYKICFLLFKIFGSPKLIWVDNVALLSLPSNCRLARKNSLVQIRACISNKKKKFDNIDASWKWSEERQDDFDTYPKSCFSCRFA